MAYGRGIYMSEYPAVCLGYGNVLVLCRVLLGRVLKVGGGVWEHFSSDTNAL